MSSNILPQKMIITVGLNYAGIDNSRQKLNPDIKIYRFKAAYRIQPNAVRVMFSGMKDKYPTMNLKYLFMAMNWIKLNNSWDGMTGQRGCIEAVIE